MNSEYFRTNRDRPPRWSMNFAQAVVFAAAFAFDAILMVRGISPWSAIWLTLTLAGGLMFIVHGHVAWLRPALSRLVSTDAARDHVFAPEQEPMAGMDSQVRVIGDGRKS